MFKSPTPPPPPPSPLPHNFVLVSVSIAYIIIEEHGVQKPVEFTGCHSF